MASVTLTLTKAELTEAIREYLERNGFASTDRFYVSVKTIPGDRPFDSEDTETTVSGVVIMTKKDTTHD